MSVDQQVDGRALLKQMEGVRISLRCALMGSESCMCLVLCARTLLHLGVNGNTVTINHCFFIFCFQAARLPCNLLKWS